MRIEGLLHSHIEDLSSSYVAFLRELIRVPSVTGNEGACQRLMRERMVEIGIFETTVLPGNNPPFIAAGRSYEERPCLVGRIPGGPAGAFILNAHVDTAPVEDELSWLHPPFAAGIEDGRLYGRGALDDKAGLAMLLLIAEAFRKTGVSLPGDLILESVIEDEDTGNGTLACTLQGFTGDAAVVIDGSGPNRIIDSHLGQIWMTFSISGNPAAASSARRTTNPVEVALKLIEALRRFESDRNGEIPVWLEIASPFFVNVGSIHGGKWAGSVPETCSLEVQVGFPPPWTPERMTAELSEIAAGFGNKELGIRVDVVPGSLAAPPFSGRGNLMVEVLQSAIARLKTGDGTVVCQAVNGHCDMRHFRTPDGKPAAAVLYGPGRGRHPHARDEYYELEDFVPVARTIASAILGWYGVR